MTQEEIRDIVKKQREYFSAGETFDINFRKNALSKLKKTIIKTVISSKINCRYKVPLFTDTSIKYRKCMMEGFA